MKKLLLACSFLFFGNSFINAQTTLVAGDIAIVGYNADDISGNDDFTFILLKDITAGTNIKFTDFGWCAGIDITGFQSHNPCGASTGAHSDGAISWTSTSALLCGTQIRIQCKTTLTATSGSVVGLLNAIAAAGDWINLVTGGDQLFAFQGTLSAPTLITGMSMNVNVGNSWEATLSQCLFNSSLSTLPAALNATNSFGINPEVDNARYNCTVTNDSPLNLRTAIFNSANWLVDDVIPYVFPLACTFSCSSCTNPTVPTVSASPTAVCAGNSSTLTITGTLNSATQWSIYTGSCGGTLLGTTTSTTFVVTPGANTTYYVRGEGGCVVPGSCGTVTVNVSAPALSANSQINVTCFGGANGSAIVNTASGGIAPYTYNWTPGNPTGDGTTSVSGLIAGTWSCTVTDNIGCNATQTFNITQPTAIVLNANTQSNVSCFGGSNGAASVVAATGGAGGYTYNWTPGNPTGDGTTSVTGLIAGTWTCTVTDANSCQTTRTFNITQPTAIVVTPASQTNVSCFGGTNGAASINTPTGGAGGYTYNWTPGNPTGDGTISVSGLVAGTWTCTVTDANSCVATQTFNITAPTALVVTPASQTNVSCFGGSNGAASINTPTGGAGGYTYNWTPGNPTGDGTVSVTGLAAGTWTCTVTDANACVATQTFNITAPTAIVVTPASQTNVSCFGGSNGAASINTPTGGAGGYTYNWTPGNPTGEGTVSVTGLTAGTWTCTVTDANACVATQTFNITSPSAIVVTPASQTNISCNGGVNGAASINTPTGGAGGYTYNWTPGNPTGDGTVSVSGLTAGTWTCTVTDANSCAATQTFNITQPTALVVNALSQTNVSCFGGSNGAASVTVSGATPAYTYNWTPGNPTGDGTASVTGLIAGTWTCTVTDANACVATRTFNITAPTAIVVTAASQTNVSCFGGSNGAASINTPTGGAGGYTYNWTPGNPTGDGTVSVTGLTAGTWTCTVTDANACVATQTFNITAPSAIVVTPASQTNISCNGGSNGAASINTPTGGAGGYTYNWTPGNPTGDGTVSVTGLIAGTWTCTVTDANSCVATQTFNITQPSAITANIASTPTSCSSNTGTATVSSVAGGAGGYTYDWTPGTPTGDGTVAVTGLGVGTWTCTITDANSCAITRTVNVTTASGPTLTAASQTNVSCFGGSNGAASVNAATGGTAPYTYNWTPGNPTGDGTVSVTGLTAGTWTCTVTDAGGCVASVTFNITAPTAIVLNANTQTNISCFGGSNGAATVLAATGGAGGYSYNWTPGNPTGDGTISVTGLSAGTWTCTVTDANLCTTTRTFNITAPAAIVVTPASQTNVSCNGGSNGAASINTPTGGAGGYTYNWTPGNPTGDGTVSVTGLAAGTWTCTVTDANACVATQTFNITAPTAIVVTPASQTNVSCFGGSNGAASINTPTGGAGGYTFNWTPGNPTGDGTVSVTGLIAGTWTCTVTDANSCVATQTFNITAPTAITANIASTPTSCSANTGTATVSSVAGGAGGYTYSWAPSGGTAATASSLGAGTYTCTITDANSCAITRTVNVATASGPTLTAASQTNLSCFGGTNGAASVNAATGGTAPYTYNWTPGNPTGDGTVSVTGLTAGTWTCTVTDAGGCVASVTFNITAPTAIVLNANTQTNVSCFGGSNGAASVFAATGGAGGYTYNWTPGNPTGDGTVSVTGLTAGTWTCTVTDANSCVATQTFNITAPSALVASVGTQANVSCFGGSDGAAAVSVTGGTTTYAYDWTPGNPTGDGTDAVTGLTVGTWTCTVTDANSCVTTQTFSITQPPVIALAPSQTNVTCNAGSNGSASVVASGGTGIYTYAWLPSGGTGASATGLTAGTYTVTVSSPVGCTATQTFNITQPAALVVTAAATPSTICSGDSSTITASYNAPPLTYCQPTYSTGTVFGDYISSVVCNTLNSTSGASPSPYYTLFPTTSPTTTTLVAGNTYTITLVCGTYTINDIAAFIDYNQNGTLNNVGEKLGETDDMGATPASTSFVFTVPLTALNGTTRLRVREMDATGTNYIDPCIVQSQYGETEDYIITITGGVDVLSYAWSPATFLSSTTGSTVNANTVTASTTYTVTATDGNGCTTTASTTVAVNALPMVTATASNSPICIGASDTLNAGGASTYVWSSGGTASMEPVTPTATSTYTVTGTDANGCANTATVSVTVNALPVVTASAVDGVICIGSTDTLVAGGASTYVWDNAATTDSIVVMPSTATTYTVTGTDANGCSNTATVTVNVNALPTVTASSLIGTICAGNTDTLVAGGANTYVWDNAATTDTILVMPTITTTYTVSGTDANGCVNTATIAVNVNAAPVVTLTLGMDTLCSIDGAMVLTGESPAGGTFSGTGVTAGSFDPAAAGLGMHIITYNYIDSFTGCSASTTDSIFVDVCTGAQSPVSVLGTQFSIFPNPTSGLLNIITNGSYATIVVTDALGQQVSIVVSNSTTTQIDLSENANGMYFVRVEQNGNYTTQRVMIAK